MIPAESTPAVTWSLSRALLSTDPKVRREVMRDAPSIVTHAAHQAGLDPVLVDDVEFLADRSVRVTAGVFQVVLVAGPDPAKVAS
jgi:hypothetical protein